MKAPAIAIERAKANASHRSVGLVMWEGYVRLKSGSRKIDLCILFAQNTFQTC